MLLSSLYIYRGFPDLLLSLYILLLCYLLLCYFFVIFFNIMARYIRVREIGVTYMVGAITVWWLLINNKQQMKDCTFVMNI